MNRRALALAFALFFSLFCMNATAQVEQVFSSTVNDEAALVEEMNAWLSSNDAKDGQTTTLLANVVNGDDSSTHYVVLDFPDYAKWQTHMDRTAKSGDFAKYQRRTSPLESGTGEGLYLRVTDNGKSWNAGDYLFVISVRVNTEAGKAYIAAFNEYVNSGLGKKAPGLIRLLAVRAGADNTHTVIISASTFVALNKFLDDNSGSAEMSVFLQKVGAISAPTGSSILRVVKVWK